MTEAEGARGTISPTNITIDEAPFAATLEQLLASVTIDSVIASNCYPEVTINLTCSFTDASNVSFLQLWFNDGGLSGFQRNFFFFAIEMNRSTDNFTVVFQQTLQLREVGGFAELAGEYRCQANTGEETAIATIEVLCESTLELNFMSSYMREVIIVHIHNYIHYACVIPVHQILCAQ